MNPNVERGAPRGFTLVELVTVMAILGILVTLAFGAMRGIRDRVARSATLQAFEAIDAGLQAYYEDWGKYPYTSTVGDFGLVSTSDDANYRPASAASDCDDKAAVLYAALRMKQRHGPYMPGGGSQAIFRKPPAAQGGYYVLGDGWGRMIRYMSPADALARSRSGGTLELPSNASAPVLESDGAEEFSDGDNMVNYGNVKPN